METSTVLHDHASQGNQYLRLFGFHVDLCTNTGNQVARYEDGGEGVISTHIVLWSEPVRTFSRRGVWKEEVRVSVFVARSSWTCRLWGDRHPNAHKKERLKTTSRMHIEVRKGSIGFFLRSFPAPLPSLWCCPLHTRLQTPFVIYVHLCFLQMECSRLPASACIWGHLCHFQLVHEYIAVISLTAINFRDMYYNKLGKSILSSLIKKILCSESCSR